MIPSFSQRVSSESLKGLHTYRTSLCVLVLRTDGNIFLVRLAAFRLVEAGLEQKPGIESMLPFPGCIPFNPSKWLQRFYTYCSWQARQGPPSQVLYSLCNQSKCLTPD